MARRSEPTRDRIVAAAARLFYGEGVRSVSVDAVAEKAGVTKRTLYYHFASKDDLIAAYLDNRDQPSLGLFKRWFAETDGGLSDKIRAIFANLARNATHPKWKGCGFLRTSAELAALPGHPAVKIGKQHKKRVEAWFAEQIADAGLPSQANALATHIMLLLDGAFMLVMLHRDPSYMVAAGEAAASLIDAARRN